MRSSHETKSGNNVLERGAWTDSSGHPKVSDNDLDSISRKNYG